MNSVPLNLVVRYACECAGLAAFCAGLDLPDLIAASEAAGRGDIDAAAYAANAAHAANDAAYNAAYAANAAAYAVYTAYAADAAYNAANTAAYDANDAAYDAAYAAANDAAYNAAYAAHAANAANDANDAAANARSQCARRASELFGLVGGRKLRLKVAAWLEKHPELHDQRDWGDGSDNPRCGTPCCVAGWACHLGGGSRGLPVRLAAAALLHVDGAPEVPFAATASRESILTALRARPQ